jgi:hypothetical protein
MAPLGFLLVPHPLLVVTPGFERVANGLGFVSVFVMLGGHSMVHGGILIMLGGAPVVLGCSQRLRHGPRPPFQSLADGRRPGP